MSTLCAEQSLQGTESTRNNLYTDHPYWSNIYSVYWYFLSHTACSWRSVYCLATRFALAYRPSSGRLCMNRNINRNCIVR